MIPEIAVVIAVYNGNQYIAETLESVLKQTFENWECIVVDDGSKDDTAAIVAGFMAKDNRFRIIKTDGGNGPYIAANIGIKKTRARYIARLDADDISLPERLAIQYDYLEKNIQINLCGSLHYYLCENGEIKFKEHNIAIDYLKWELNFRNRLIHSTMMFRKEWFEKIGYYPEKRLSQDWHIWLEAVNSDSLFVTDKPLVLWRLHGNSITRTENANQLIAASEVSAYNIQHRMGLAIADKKNVKAIIAAIRGEDILEKIVLDQAVDLLIKVYQLFGERNKINKEIKNDFHVILDCLCAKYVPKKGSYVIRYLKTIIVAGISWRWAKGFVRIIYK
jgi:glycosyltransferase involved in cell wall biosynthesis